MSENRNRGEGGMANALRTRRRGPEERPPETEPPRSTSQPRRRNQRKMVGKRSDPDYMLASAFVRVDVYDRVRQALLNPEVKRQALIELDESGVRHQPNKPLYSDVVEMLLKEWLERNGWED